MPRRKQLTFKIKDLRCAQYLIAELSQLPQLANFDMTSIEISIKENRPAPKIIKKDIDVLIDRLQRGFSANKHTLTQLNGRYLVTNTHLASYPTERKIFGDKYSFSQMDENHTRICKQMDKRRINKPLPRPACML